MPRKGYKQSAEHTGRVREALRGRKLSEEHKRKIGQALRGKRRPPRSAEHRQNLGRALRGKPSGMKGKEHTQEARRKMTEAAKGRRHSKETRQKMSEIAKRRLYSAETRQKISESHKGLKHSAATKRKMGEAVKAAWRRGAFEGRKPRPPYVTYQGIQMRSSWEGRLAHAFDQLGWGWEYEPRKFQYLLDDGKHTYTPDLYVPHLDCYFDPHWAWATDLNKFEAVREQCPIALIVVNKDLLLLYERLAQLGELSR